MMICSLTISPHENSPSQVGLASGSRSTRDEGGGSGGGGGGGHSGGAFAKKEEINYEWAQVNCRLCLMRDSVRC